MLAPGLVLDEALADTICRQLRETCSPRHVPARIVAVADLPRNRSGTFAEVAIRDAVHGRQVANREALANPEPQDALHDLAELAR